MMEVAPGHLARTHTAPTTTTTHSTHAREGTPPTRPFVKTPSSGYPSASSSSSSSAAASRANPRVFSPAPTLLPGPSHLRGGPPSAGNARPQHRQPQHEEAKPPKSGHVMASDSIINQAADSSKSLYQICIKLRQRLSEVPDFELHLAEMDRENEIEGVDPVESMWWCLRRGYPLMTIYNALNPEQPLEVDESKVPQSKWAKTASFKFVQACLKDLGFPPDECFLIMDLYGEDTTGFVKVTRVVNRVLDMLQERDLLIRPQYDEASAAPEGIQKRTRRDYIVGELVDTERKYVQDLETLQQFKRLVEQKGEVPGDTIHAIFLNLNALLDFQRRFLIRIETMNALPEDQQNWGLLFSQYHQSFTVYEPYISNQQTSDEQAMKEFDKLAKIGHQITIDRATLSGFLMRPFQRLSKYPLLLKELRDKCNLSVPMQDDLTTGITAATSILETANAVIDRQHRTNALKDVFARVEDWKGHDPSSFGDLLLFGNHIVVKNDGRNDIEKEEYKIYLFEKILLCCKDLNQTKQKNKVMGKSGADKRAKPKLQLKGRIFTQNVTDIVKLQKPGSYTIQIFWKGDPGVENFVIRFLNEEVMNKWYEKVGEQRNILNEASRARQGRSTPSASDTQFAWVREHQANLSNPHQQDEEYDEVDEDALPQAPYAGQSEFSMSRNASSNSLRSRSTTGESGPPMNHPSNRGPPSRFPMAAGLPNLSLKTQMAPNGVSPGDRMGPSASYFSPTADSPVSGTSRGSSSSNMYPFPRQETPSNAWPESHDHNRYTAPAMGPQASRDGQVGYQGNTRTPQRPSISTSQGSQQQQQQQQARLRSASSPDIHNALGPGRRGMNPSAMHPPVPEVPVPPFPQHMAHMKAPVNRSQNSSPTSVPTHLPTRSATQSPGGQRDRMTSQGQVQPPQPQQQHGGSHHGSGDYDYQQRYDHRPYQSPPGQPASFTPPQSEYRGGMQSSQQSSFSSTNDSNSIITPAQLKVKVSFEENYVTLVIGTNISYQSLVDRIDAKLSRFTDSSIGRGSIRLRYRDEDGDFVTIRSDEDINIAFSDWKEQQRSQLMHGQLGEIELFCQGIDN